MKAFIHGVDEQGRDILGTGLPKGGIVTREYKSLKNLIKYSLKDYKGTYHIEAFHNWDNRYSKANIDIFVTV
jgi:hypothetical protein